MLLNILNKFCASTGISKTSQRSSALDFINRAAEEIYIGSDLPGSLQEVTVSVTKDAMIALPDFVGKVRGIKINEYETKVDTEHLLPRFSTSPWASDYDTFRYVGTSPIMTEHVNVGVMQIQIPEVETTPAVVTVSGSTYNSEHVSDEVTLNALINLTTSHFTSVKSITKNINTKYNISIKDTNGVLLALLHNNKSATLYHIFIISKYLTGTGYVDVCYKQAFRPFISDGDEFICPGFDDAILYKALELWSSDEPGKEQRAMLYNEKARVITDAAADDTNKGVAGKILCATPVGFGVPWSSGDFLNS